jgi:predicted SAM-dependent methyltransferase
MDISSWWAMARGDITALPYREEIHQFILCSHVLEHISDDQAAMREMYRVLVPGGMVLIQVPLQGERTFEDLTATRGEDRERLYGRADHVRIYGRDIMDRLSGVGFEVDLIWYGKQTSQREQVRYGLDPEEVLIIAMKP